MYKIKSPIEYKNIPLNPGVYLMKNDKSKIIYVGKAKNLRNRVTSYFTNINSHTTKTLELVKNISDIEFFICSTEVEALILENNLIKKYKPKYNILLKDEKNTNINVYDFIDNIIIRNRNSYILWNKRDDSSS